MGGEGLGKQVTPINFIFLWRMMHLLFLLALWVMTDNQPQGFMFILLLTIMVSLRWRFSVPGWVSFIDLLLCFLFFPFWEGSAYGAALPLFDSLVRGNARYGVFVPLIFFVSPVNSWLLCWYLGQATFIGIVLRVWQKQLTLDLLEIDHERHTRYELERLKIDLLQANRQAAHTAEIAERNRIARDLHDHLGHDLTGAMLGVQAIEYLSDEEQKQAILVQVKQRLERSTSMLRETVHDLTPVARFGANQLEFIANEYLRGLITFNKSGNMALVPVHLWSLLEPCLKEILTNIARHSDATKVDIHLDVTNLIVRLSVQDNGKASDYGQSGTGLRHLKMRARAAGGSISVDVSSGYLVVCVLPLIQEE